MKSVYVYIVNNSMIGSMLIIRQKKIWIQVESNFSVHSKLFYVGLTGLGLNARKHKTDPIHNVDIFPHP